jgi:dTDP-4-amino-4,6-dideoxygalactose transaminase
MHLQPIFSGYESVGGAVTESLFRDGLCLPSTSKLTAADLARVVTAVAYRSSKNLSSTVLKNSANVIALLAIC